MKVLLDENMPHGMRSHLTDHEVFVTARLGWNSIRNGLLLGKAEEAGFEILVTADQSMSYQQKIVGRSLGVLVLDTNRWRSIKPRMPSIAEALKQCAPGTVVYVEI